MMVFEKPLLINICGFSKVISRKLVTNNNVFRTLINPSNFKQGIFSYTMFQQNNVYGWWYS